MTVAKCSDINFTGTQQRVKIIRKVIITGIKKRVTKNPQYNKPSKITPTGLKLGRDEK